jgi:hypothetical protein
MCLIVSTQILFEYTGVVPGAINRSKKTLGSVKTGLAAVVIINKMKGEMVKTWKSRIEIITR